MAATVNGFGGGGMISEAASISASISGRTVTTKMGYVARAGKIAMLNLSFEYSGTALAEGTKIGQLPDGFLPAREMELFTGQNTFSYDNIRIDAAGNLYTTRATMSTLGTFNAHGVYILA